MLLIRSPHLGGRPRRCLPAMPSNLRWFTPSSVWDGGGGLRRGRRVVSAREPGRNGDQTRSFDSEDDLVWSLAEEVLRIADPGRIRRVTESLNLQRKIGMVRYRRPAPCECCQGTGSMECSYCHGTGVLTIGDEVYCSMSGCQYCPICAATGEVKCKHCKGTGYRAGWMEPGCPTK